MKLKELNEECFVTVMRIIESNKPDLLFNVLSNNNAENCARLYVASLLLRDKGFPDVIKSRYSNIVNEESDMFFVLYKKASDSGMGYNEIKTLYETSSLPEMIRTKDERNDRHQENKKDFDNINFETITDIIEKFGLSDSYTVLKQGSCPLSNEAKAMRKNGAIVSSYKIIVNGTSVIITIINDNNEYSYDINSFHCKDVKTFCEEFTHKFLYNKK